MKTTKTLNRMDVIDRAQNVADRIQTICLLLEHVNYLADASDTVSAYSEPVDVHSDLIDLCVSELLSAADKLNTLDEDCRSYDIENHETE